MQYTINGRPVIPLSDVDALMDLKGRGWILYEIKYGDALPPIGQKLMIERMIDDFSKAGKAAVAFVCSHGEPGTKVVYLKDCIVTACYTTALGWKYYGKDYTTTFAVKGLTDIYIKRYVPDMIEAKEGRGNK